MTVSPRKMLALFPATLAFAVSVHADQTAGPYRDQQNNQAYNRLFCDEASLFNPGSGMADPWQKILLAPAPDAAAVEALAVEPHGESCVRLLADTWLRQHFRQVQPGQLLGVVIEVTRDEGQDTLSAYADGSVRYIDHAEKNSRLEPGQSVAAGQVRALLASATAVFKRTGPWDRKRLPPPRKGKVRLSFLAADGLHFGEGSFAAISKDEQSARMMRDALPLLQIMVDASAAR